MTKKVLILSSSPRRGGNSDTLCNEFMRGAIESGNEAEKVFRAGYMCCILCNNGLSCHAGKPFLLRYHFQLLLA